MMIKAVLRTMGGADLGYVDSPPDTPLIIYGGMLFARDRAVMIIVGDVCTDMILYSQVRVVTAQHAAVRNKFYVHRLDMSFRERLM